MTDNIDMTEYEIGYCKPPAKNRFQKGKSGNPSGRPKGVKSLQSAIYERLAMLVEVSEKGKRNQVQLVEAIAMQACKKALEGDYKFMRWITDIQLEADQISHQDNKREMQREEIRRIVSLGEKAKKDIDKIEKIMRIKKALEPFDDEEKASYEAFVKEYGDEEPTD